MEEEALTRCGTAGCLIILSKLYYIDVMIIEVNMCECVTCALRKLCSGEANEFWEEVVYSEDTKRESYVSYGTARARERGASRYFLSLFLSQLVIYYEEVLLSRFFFNVIDPSRYDEKASQ